MEEETTRRDETELSQEKLELLRSYFNAFCNLYGITPLYRALRIIRKQNPELELGDEEFITLAEQLATERNSYYIIAGEDDIYNDVPATPPLKREIIFEYLYIADDFASYEALKVAQGDKPFYVPGKEELLRYQDEWFAEETKESLAMGTFLRDTLKLKNADEVLSDLQLAAEMDEEDPDDIISIVQRLAGKRWNFPSQAREEEFFRHYTAMYDHTRRRANRGFTSAELRARMGGGAATPIGF